MVRQISCLFLSLVSAVSIYAAGGIPEFRVRLIFEDSRAPVEWVCVFEGGDKKIPFGKRASLAEEDKWESAFRGGYYEKTDDGWVTIRGMDLPEIKNYGISIWPAGGRLVRIYDLLYYDKRKWKYDEGAFNEKTVPKLLRLLPPEQRVFKVTKAPSRCRAHFVFTCYRTYKEIMYGMAVDEVVMANWSKEMADFDHPWEFQAEAPYYVREYMHNVSGYLYEIEIGFKPLDKNCKPSAYPEWAPLTENQKNEIVVRAKTFLCKELLEKKRKWGSAFQLSKWVVERPIFIEAHCEGLEPSDFPATSIDPDASNN